MTGPENYREAQRLADAYKQAHNAVEAMPGDTIAQFEERQYAHQMALALLTKAQVHATLAQAAATAEAGNCHHGWADVVTSPPLRPENGRVRAVSAP